MKLKEMKEFEAAFDEFVIRKFNIDIEKPVLKQSGSPVPKSTLTSVDNETDNKNSNKTAIASDIITSIENHTDNSNINKSNSNITHQSLPSTKTSRIKEGSINPVNQKSGSITNSKDQNDVVIIKQNTYVNTGRNIPNNTIGKSSYNIVSNTVNDSGINTGRNIALQSNAGVLKVNPGYDHSSFNNPPAMTGTMIGHSRMLEPAKAGPVSNNASTINDAVGNIGSNSSYRSIKPKDPSLDPINVPSSTMANQGMTNTIEVIDTSPRKQRNKLQCGTCEGCLAVECTKCANCLDKPKYGGNNSKKQKCEQRRCRMFFPSGLDLGNNLNSRFRRSMNNLNVKPVNTNEFTFKASSNMTTVTPPILSRNPPGPVFSSNIVPGPILSSKNLPGPNLNNTNLAGPNVRSINPPGPTVSSNKTPGYTMSSNNLPGPIVSSMNPSAAIVRSNNPPGPTVSSNKTPGATLSSNDPPGPIMSSNKTPGPTLSNSKTHGYIMSSNNPPGPTLSSNKTSGPTLSSSIPQGPPGVGSIPPPSNTIPTKQKEQETVRCKLCQMILTNDREILVNHCKTYHSAQMKENAARLAKKNAEAALNRDPKRIKV